MTHHFSARPTLATFAAVLVCAAAPAFAQSTSADCPLGRNLLLVNGRIHTMDAADKVVSSLQTEGNRFSIVGGKTQPGSCTQRIDLRGRTVVPGIIDNHNHIVLLGLRPGHDTRLENADSIAAVLATIAAKTKELPGGQWITSIGGFDINQFTPPPAAPRFPTLAELDSVAPKHPVYIQQSFSGPSVTNSLGKAFFASKGIEVGAGGSLAGGFQTPNPTTRALYALRQMQTLEDMKRGTQDAMRYAASLGVTTHLDEGAFPSAGNDTDGAAHADEYHVYDALLALYHEGKLINRYRIDFLHMEDDPTTPHLKARLANVFPKYGADMLKTVGIGEFTAGNSAIIGAASPTWEAGTRLVAQAGWRNENHSLTPADFKVIIDGWERINASLPAPGITKSRWVVAHVPFITREYADKLKALGGGVSVLGGWRYISGTAQQNGPPFKMLKDAGIPMGMSSDGMQISPMNPWLGLYYVVTGKNARGELINAGQTLERNEALRLYTAANGWFLGEEALLGTIEPGKYADLVVLSANYFDAKATPDDAIKKIRSLLTVVDGRIVHGDPGKL
ncbi:MAG TPA: amidohydrolase family protein [Gammaproteobacteria bacterium]|nr:amidohydrolase family protein [Gammaproteobacteria bacterium]